jgi:membrane associated rhomboid family serine protease
LIPLKDNIPTRDFPIVTLALVVANILVFVFFQGALFGPHGGFNSAGDESKVVHYSFIPYELKNPGKECDAVSDGGETAVACKPSAKADSQPPVWVTIFTSMFMHGGVLHIAGNLLFLWIFGNNIEDSMGRLKFALFYLAGGVVATLAQFAFHMNSQVPSLGASGAIAAVLGGYALLYPRARVVTLIFIVFFATIITLPALLVLGLWFALQVLDASSQPLAGGGVAYFAHIGGFLFGVLLIRVFARQVQNDYEQRSRIPVY